MLAALSPGLTLDENHAIRNPIGIGWVEDVEKGVVGAGLSVLLAVSVVAALASLVLRFRRSRGEERQQLKWFTYAGALLLLLPLGEFLPNGNLSTAVFGLLIAFLPVAAGIAILRYRLYDIDRIINRTLVYELLSTLLGAVYAGVVLVFGELSSGIGTKSPSWAVAGATLAVAALFQPGRRRIQQVVDRRFNRRKYNAAKTIQRSPPACATKLTSVPSPPSWWRWLTRRWSRPGCRFGFGPPQTTHRIHPTVTHGQLPGPAELVIPSPSLCLPGPRSVKAPQRRTTSVGVDRFGHRGTGSGPAGLRSLPAKQHAPKALPHPATICGRRPAAGRSPGQARSRQAAELAGPGYSLAAGMTAKQAEHFSTRHAASQSLTAPPGPRP